MAKISVISTTGRTQGVFTSDAPIVSPDLKLEKRIGEGHSAEVFLASTPSARELVFKVVRADETPETKKKLAAELVRERRSSIEFHQIDPAFVELFDVGNLTMGKKQMPAVVMEMVNGKPLADWRSGGPRREPAVALALLSRLTEVLSALEQAGYRHNDLHTENIFAKNDDPATLRIIDLGRASKLSDPTKRSRITFAAPERRAGGGTTGIGSDIYTVGIVLFTLLAGKAPPLDPRSPSAATHPVLIQKLVTGLKLAPEAAARLETVLKTALGARPEDRFSSFAAFKKSIDAVL